MEFRSYNAELAISNLLFKKLFNNIQIEKNVAKGKKELITVNCVFDQKSRIYRNWHNSEKRATIKLPMIAINRTGYSRAPDRLNNLHNEVKYEILPTFRCQEILTPVPVDITYDVSIIARDPSDIDQIASNFMVFFNSSLWVTCMHPKYEGVKLNNQVMMADSISEEHQSELDGSQDDFITSTFNFTFKTFLFAGMEQAKKVPQQIISSYISTYISTYVYEFQTDQEVLSYLSAENHNKLSTILSTETSGELTAYINDPEISDEIYDGPRPLIHEIHTGWYGINNLCADMEQEMDNIDKYRRWDKFKDLLIWKIDGQSTNQFPANVYVERHEP